MDIVSYRGPGAAGGVSSGLESGWRNQRQSTVSWWFVSEDALQCLTPTAEKPSFITHIAEPVIKGHYAYCNEFLWPLMHDLPEYASYDSEKRRLYRKFNHTFAQYINFEKAGKRRYFVQDYQLALLPRLITGSGRSSIFWHIPWPKHVKEEYVEAIAEVAQGLLAAESVGFHTTEYAKNFMSFVQKHLGQYNVNQTDMLVYKRQEARSGLKLQMASGFENSAYILRPFLQSVATPANATKVIVQPLGIDVEKWDELSRTANIDLSRIGVAAGEKFVLSVDRADYTKAVIDRLKIIDHVLENNEKLRGEVAFVQICGRSRAGLPVFDKYWHDCRALARAVNDRWRKDGWEPIRWVEKPLSAGQLAALYPQATAMLVNPVRDGLNLTAKEFVACRHSTPGVLLLSPGAGVWHELGQHALAADPRDHKGSADSIVRALHMPPDEVRARTMGMRYAVEKNPLSLWWKQFMHAASHAAKEVAADREAKSA